MSSSVAVKWCRPLYGEPSHITRWKEYYRTEGVIGRYETVGQSTPQSIRTQVAILNVQEDQTFWGFISVTEKYTFIATKSTFWGFDFNERYPRQTENKYSEGRQKTGFIPSLSRSTILGRTELKNTSRSISCFLPSSISVSLLYIKKCYTFRLYLHAIIRKHNT